jgi:hypothetical protein
MDKTDKRAKDENDTPAHNGFIQEDSAESRTEKYRKRVEDLRDCMLE